MIWRGFPLLLAILLPGTAFTQTAQTAPPLPASAIEAMVTHENVSNGNADWREATVRFKHAFAPRHAIDLGLTETSRFGLHDTQLQAGYVAPLSSVLTATLDANVSPSHRVLARHAVGGTLQYEFRPAWLLHGGLRSTDYDDVTVNQGMLMLEHYFSSFSVAAAWRPARAFDTTAHSREVRAAYYYGNKNSIAVSLAAGREATNLGTSIVLASVRSIVFTGRHWFAPNWALNYAAGHTRQGDFYHRSGISIGVQYAF